MYVLGIESSCDDTCCAVVNGRRILSNVTISSLSLHKPYGGIVPEIATRNHLKFIDRVFRLAIERANIDVKDIGVVGFTHRPGLIGALVVGANFAKALSLALDKPLIGVNHLYAHLYAPFLDNRIKFPFPFIGLVVSGGHTELFFVSDFDNIKCVGKTRDDAAGEVFDKVARAFGLGYPGGWYIDKLFKEEYKDSFKFKCADLGLNFSFSGIKTALVYRKIELEKDRKLSRELIVKLLSSFQESIVKNIVDKTILAAKKYRVKTIVAGGGVVANRRLRRLLRKAAVENKLRLLLAPVTLSSDNAVTVAGLSYYLYNVKRRKSDIGIKVYSN